MVVARAPPSLLASRLVLLSDQHRWFVVRPEPHDAHEVLDNGLRPRLPPDRLRLRLAFHEQPRQRRRRHRQRAARRRLLAPPLALKFADGVAANPRLELAQVASELKRADHGVLVPGEVRANRVEQAGRHLVPDGANVGIWARRESRVGLLAVVDRGRSRTTPSALFRRGSPVVEDGRGRERGRQRSARLLQELDRRGARLRRRLPRERRPRLRRAFVRAEIRLGLALPERLLRREKQRR